MSPPGLGRKCSAVGDQQHEISRLAGGAVRDEDLFIGSGSVIHMYEQEGLIEEALQKMFDRPHRPTAIMTSFNTVAEAFFSGAEWYSGDFNDDAAVDDIDATFLVANWQHYVVAANTPEPGNLSLLIGLVIAMSGRPIKNAR